jgi:hypothetical protein
MKNTFIAASIMVMLTSSVAFAQSTVEVPNTGPGTFSRDQFENGVLPPHRDDVIHRDHSGETDLLHWHHDHEHHGSNRNVVEVPVVVEPEVEIPVVVEPEPEVEEPTVRERCLDRKLVCAIIIHHNRHHNHGDKDEYEHRD